MYFWTDIINWPYFFSFAFDFCAGDVRELHVAVADDAFVASPYTAKITYSGSVHAEHIEIDDHNKSIK